MGTAVTTVVELETLPPKTWRWTILPLSIYKTLPATVPSKVLMPRCTLTDSGDVTVADPGDGWAAAPITTVALTAILRIPVDTLTGGTVMGETDARLIGAPIPAITNDPAEAAVEA